MHQHTPSFVQTQLTFEEWRDVPGYEGRYQVSNMGRVRSQYVVGGRGKLGPWRIRKQATHHTSAYRYLILNGNERTKDVFVHVLVLLAFVGPPPEGFRASHLDGNRGHNALSNLVWESMSQNMLRKLEHGTMANGTRNGSVKLSEEQVREIRTLRLAHMKKADIAKQFGIGTSQVGRICRGQSWAHLDP